MKSTINTLAIRHPEQVDGRLILVIGTGLVGSSVLLPLSRLHGYSSLAFGLRLDWDHPDNCLKLLLGELENTRFSRLEVLWAAGSAGFLADEKTLRAETQLLSVLLSGLVARFEGVLNVSLVSSAGGVYEGGGHIRSIAGEGALRPYGEAKLAQETLLRAAGVSCQVYRLSSVYGHCAPGQRMGLLNVLLEGALTGGLSEVYASPRTLRDYVFSEDIGRYIGAALVRGDSGETRLLASGRPTSVQALIQRVSAATRRRVRVQYRSRQENAGDIIFQPSLVPPEFRSAPLEETVHLLAARRRGNIGLVEPLRRWDPA